MEALKSLALAFLNCEIAVAAVSVAVIYGLTELFKLPFKRLVLGNIKNAKNRERMTNIIKIVPFAIGAVEGLLFTKFGFSDYSVELCLGYGATASLIYEVWKRMLAADADDKEITGEVAAMIVGEVKSSVGSARNTFLNLVDKVKEPKAKK